MKRASFIATLALSGVFTAAAQEWLDRVDDALSLQTRNGVARVDFSGLLDVEGYYTKQPPPGLVFGDDCAVFNPRLTLFADARLGKHLYSFVQARVDRGFDPHSKDHDARFDEYLLRYTPFDEARLNVQIGKFATVVGNWVARHDSWNNPFITAPLPYEFVTGVADATVAPTAAAFAGRKNLRDNKAGWLPLLWGPAYTSGASVFGTVEKFDYAFEFKNASVSSRPAVWDATELGWEHPTVSGRIGWRPEAAWNVGASFSYGTYLQPRAAASPGFPAGRSIGDYNQILFAGDVGYAWHQWQLWGEIFLSRFEVPGAGDADTLACYIEAKYKFSSQFFAALRWNQHFFGDVPDGTGGETSWDRNVWRLDMALGWRLTRHLQGKVQYSFTGETGNSPQGDQLAAAQLTLKF